ncbi:hypothetical protein AALB39_17805 [Lachnospiraceae bacterium 54-53]
MKSGNKNNGFISKIPNSVWLLISFATAMLLWWLLSMNPRTARSFPNVMVVLASAGTMIERGVFFKDIGSSMISVTAGFALGFAIALPVAVLMAWYKPVRNILEPWIQFIRNIPDADGQEPPGAGTDH